MNGPAPPPLSREWLQRVELQPLALLRVLNPRLLQIVDDRVPEVIRAEDTNAHPRQRLAAPIRPRHLLVHGECPVRRQALHREQPRHSNAARVLVRLIVQRLRIGTPGDGGVDLLLPLPPPLSPLGEQPSCLLGPGQLRLSRDFPLLPFLV